MIRTTCQDCGTDWTGTTVLMCPMCGGSNIRGEIFNNIKTELPLPTVPIPPGLETWYKNVMKHVKKET